MKRYGFLWEKFISYENLLQAYKNAIKGKKHYPEIQKIENDIEKYILLTQQILINGWEPCEYRSKEVSCNYKKRDVQIVKFFPDRIIHHAITLILNPIFVPTFIHDSYQCIKGKGAHKAIAKTRKNIDSSKIEDLYMLKMDIKKFYPSVDNELLKSKIEKKIKDKKFLSVVFSLIDSFNGIPVGNYTSQIFGNLFLNELDHKIKEKNKSYIRYADDMIIIGDKVELQNILKMVTQWLSENKLCLKHTTHIAPFSSRPLDFIGFRFYRTHTRPRKATIFRTLKKLRKKNYSFLPSIFGWVSCSKSCKILLVKLFMNSIGINNNVYLLRYLMR